MQLPAVRRDYIFLSSLVGLALLSKLLLRSDDRHELELLKERAERQAEARRSIRWATPEEWRRIQDHARNTPSE